MTLWVIRLCKKLAWGRKFPPLDPRVVQYIYNGTDLLFLEQLQYNVIYTHYFAINNYKQAMQHSLTAIYRMDFNEIMQKVMIDVIVAKLAVLDFNEIKQIFNILVIVTVFTSILRSVLKQAVKWVYNQLTSLVFKQNQQDQIRREAEAFPEVEPDTEEVFIDISDSHADFLASATNVGMQTDLRPLETAAHNPNNGLYQLQPHAVQTTPEKMEITIVQENSPGVIWVKWNQTEADYYELEYDRQTRNSIKVSSTECLLDSMLFHFPSKMFYNIRVRGVNGRGPGEWSESAVGLFTSLPEQPQKPLAVHVNSSTDVSLVVEKPAKRENSKPVMHFVVEYHTTEDTRWTKQAFLVNELNEISFNGRSAWIINLRWFVNIAPTYHVQISHRNEDGDSLPREGTIRTNKIPPGKPKEPSVAFRNTDTIIIKWEKPETNAYAVDHYEVHWEVNKQTTETKTTKTRYAVIRHLKSGRRCLFKVRAVNKESCKGKFTEISANTSYMMCKVLKVFGAGIIGASSFSLLALILVIGAILVKLAVKKTTCSQIIKSYGVLAAVIAVIGTAVSIAINPMETIPVIGAGIGIALTTRNSEKDLKRHLSLFPEDSAHLEEENLNEQIQESCMKEFLNLIDRHPISFLFCFCNLCSLILFAAIFPKTPGNVLI